jgi:hypothetical protein
MGSRNLRVGLLLDGPLVRAWEHRAIEEIAAAEGVEVALVAYDAAPPARSRWARLRALPFDAYTALDRRVFGRHALDAFRPVDASRLLADRPELPLRRDRRPAHLAPESVDALRAAALDVLLHLGSRPLTGAALDVPTLGVWTFGDLELERHGFAPYLAEAIGGVSTWESALQVIRDDGPPRVLYRSYSSFEASPRPGALPISLARGRSPIAWKNASFPARALRSFAEGDAKGSALPAAAVAPRRPGLAATLHLGAAVAARVLARWRERRFDLPWFLAIRTAPSEPFADLPEKEGVFAADPMLVEHAGRRFVLYEEAPLATGKGRICCAELDAAGRPLESRVVLEEAWHLSYPFVFEHDGAWYLIPESSERKTVELYRAVDFPWRFERVAVLLDGVSAADATVWREAGQLWMFVAIAAPGAMPNEELHLFHSRAPEGPWTPHPRNPIVSDVRCARPAGPLFVEDGVLIRPAQDCASHYGSAIWLQRVDHLSETDYRETPLRRIGPEWRAGSEATHTIARAGAFEIRDGRRRVRRPRPR